MTGRRSPLIALLVVVLLAMAGCSTFLQARDVPRTPEVPEVTPTPPSDATRVTLYFGDFQAQYVMPEERTADQAGEETLADVVMRELIAGPTDPHLHRTLPENTRVVSIEVVDGVAFVNLSREVQQVAGSAGEIMAIRSIVYSLTDLPDIEKVQILIEGRTSESLGGHMVLEEPLARGPIVTDPMFVDEDRAAWFQDRLEQGLDAYRTDPLQVARFDARGAGFTTTDDFEFVEEKGGTATVRARHGQAEYLITLVQPVKEGADGVWMMTSIEPAQGK